MEVPILGGSYSARSVIANAQRCINYFPELNRGDAPTQMTLYQRPGRRFHTSPINPGQGRGLYRASNGELYGVVEQSVYHIDSGLTFNLLGVLVTPSNTQISFADNGVTIVLVDGSAFGYTIDLVSNAFAQIFDPTGSFNGSTQVAYLDTYILYNYPGTRFYGCTLSNEIVFDALFIAGKDGYPDPLSGMIVNRLELLLFGQFQASEIWYDVGGVAFPFERLPGAYIEHGCAAPFSLASYDNDTMWLAIDAAGDAIVLRLRAYDVAKISSYALDLAMQKMKARGADLSKTAAFVYQQNGHVFYQLNFFSGNETWVYDVSLGDDPSVAWHQETWQNPLGGPQRMRDGCGAFAYGRNFTLDHELGDLYEIDQTLFVDQVAGTDCPIVCIRGFPHLTHAPNPSGVQPTPLDGKRVQVNNIRANIEVGLSTVPDQVVGLRWSLDRGQTFGNTIMMDAGAPGAYSTNPLWTQAGMARDFVFEIIHQINGPAALQGLWLDVQVLAT